MIKKLLLAAVLTLSASLFGAPERSPFSRIKVEAKLLKPPVVSVGTSVPHSTRIAVDPQWLVVRVIFHPNLRDGETYLDDVKMSVQALFPLSRGYDGSGLFKGEQTFWTICCDGKTHTAVMFLPPHLIQRYVYLADGYSGVHTPQRGSIKIEVVFTDRSGRELGRGYYGVPGNAVKQAETFARLARRVVPQCVIDGAFWERDATPWRYMPPEHFDLVKPAGLKLPDAPTPPRGNNVVRGPKRGNRPRTGNNSVVEK